MAFNLSDYLWRQAIRLRRDNFNRPRVLAEELYTILRGIQVETTGPVSIQDPTTNVPTDFPPVEDLDIPVWDPDLPELGTNEPDQDVNDDGTFSREKNYFWHRAIFPGLITSHASGANYNVTVYPNGDLITMSGGKFGPFQPDEPISKNVTARVTDESLAGTISPNAWVYVYWVAEYLVVEETHRNSDGQVISKNTELEVIQEDWLFVAPSSGGGGKVARVTQTITARSGRTPGKGRAMLYDFSKGGELDPVTGEISDPTLSDGEEVDVYSSVSSEIESGEDGIQVKRIDNAWFIDVQDCRNTDDS